jgi:hypothetical protein
LILCPSSLSSVLRPSGFSSVLHLSSHITAATETANAIGLKSSSPFFEWMDPDKTADHMSVDLPIQPKIGPATVDVARVLLQRLDEQQQKPAASKREGITKRGPYINGTRVKEIRKQIGAFNPNAMQAMKVKERRKLLAVGASVVKTRRREVEEAVGFGISEKEYTNIQLHALHPRPMKDAPKISIHRRKVKDELITALLHSLESGGKLQQNAFGTKMIEIVGGLEHVMTENIKRS